MVPPNPEPITTRFLSTFGEAGVAPCQGLSHPGSQPVVGTPRLSRIAAIERRVPTPPLGAPPPVPAGVAPAAAHVVGPAGSVGRGDRAAPGQTSEALEHLQAIDVPLERSLTPGPRDPGLDGGIVLTQPFGEAPEGRECARGGARQPRIELGRLALADEGGEVLGERDRLRQLGRLRGQLRQLVAILVRGPCRRAKDQPGGLTRGEPASWRLRHHRQWLIAPALPGRQALRLAHASDIESHHAIHAILAPKALAADHPEEMCTIPTPVIPPSQESGFVRIETTAVAAMVRLALGKRRALEVPLHGAPTDADPVGNRIEGPSLLMLCPHLLVVRPPPGAPLVGQSSRRGGRLWRGERDRGWLGSCRRTGRIVHRRRRMGMLRSDERQLGGVSPEDVSQHVREILQQSWLPGRGAGPGAAAAPGPPGGCQRYDAVAGRTHSR
jgi:hypothetical protein